MGYGLGLAELSCLDPSDKQGASLAARQTMGRNPRGPYGRPVSSWHDCEAVLAPWGTEKG